MRTMMYLEQVHDGEAVSSISPSVLNSEVEPLCMLLSVQIMAEVELIIMRSPGIKIHVRIYYCNDLTGLEGNLDYLKTHVYARYM